jgi:hypothetical protein
MAAPKNHLTGDAIFPIRRLYGVITIGATGAVSAFAGYGIESCARTAQGDYAFVLDKSYKALVFAHLTSLNSTIDDILSSIKSEDVDHATVPTLSLYTYSVAGAASDPASGSLLYVEIVVVDTME